MNFYGGGYSDLKCTTDSWINSFNEIINSDKWINGYKEVNGGVAYQSVASKWEELIGNGAYICRPNTPLTNEWYKSMISLLDTKVEDLKKYPASNPRDCYEIEQKYPIEWNEMLGRIFHKVSYEYRNKIINTLPISIFSNYI
jgi:hypothetical protein